MTEKPDIKELAAAYWRLEKWLENLNSDRKMAAKSALRSIKKYISASRVEVIDPIGSKFDPGLAIEVINNEAEGLAEEDLVIIETLTPYVYQDGGLIQYARVIIGADAKTAKTNKEKAEEKDLGNKTEAYTAKNDEITIGEDKIERMMKYAKIL